MLYIKCENFNGLTLDNNKDNMHSINFLFTNGIYFLEKYSVLAVKALARDLFFYLTPTLEGVSHNLKLSIVNRGTTTQPLNP